MSIIEWLIVLTTSGLLNSHDSILNSHENAKLTLVLPFESKAASNSKSWTWIQNFELNRFFWTQPKKAEVVNGTTAMTKSHFLILKRLKSEPIVKSIIWTIRLKKVGALGTYCLYLNILVLPIYSCKNLGLFLYCLNTLHWG